MSDQGEPLLFAECREYRIIEIALSRLKLKEKGIHVHVVKRNPQRMTMLQYSPCLISNPLGYWAKQGASPKVLKGLLAET